MTRHIKDFWRLGSDLDSRVAVLLALIAMKLGAAIVRRSLADRQEGEIA